MVTVTQFADQQCDRLKRRAGRGGDPAAFDGDLDTAGGLLQHRDRSILRALPGWRGSSPPSVRRRARGGTYHSFEDRTRRPYINNLTRPGQRSPHPTLLPSGRNGRPWPSQPSEAAEAARHTVDLGPTPIGRGHLLHAKSRDTVAPSNAILTLPESLHPTHPSPGRVSGAGRVILLVMTAPVEAASEKARAWVAARLAAPTEALEIQDVEIPPPGPNEVRIAVEAFCLDFNDIDTIHGRYFLLKFEPPFVPGMAAAGVVRAAGPGAETLLGKRVVGCTVGAQGSYASSALLNVPSVQLVPSWLDCTDAVAMYFPYLLGWLAIRVRARVQAGDVVLVHAAAGGIGSGVVQLAKAFGATVIATAGTDEKVKLCYELGADHAVNYTTGDFVAYVADVTNGKGVDIAFDTIGGQVTQDTFRAMAFNGRHLIVGFSADIGVEEHPISLQPGIYGNFDLVGVCFAFVDSPRAARLFGMNFLSTADGVRIWAEVLQLAKQGRIRPVIGRHLAFEDVPSGLAALERRQTTGRSVVTLS